MGIIKADWGHNYENIFSHYRQVAICINIYAIMAAFW